MCSRPLPLVLPYPVMACLECDTHMCRAQMHRAYKCRAQMHRESVHDTCMRHIHREYYHTHMCRAQIGAKRAQGWSEWGKVIGKEG